MALFILYCLDKDGGLPVRLATRAAHLAYIGERAAAVKLAGPVLAADGEMAGSLIIVEAEDLAAATAFSAQDPYTLAGLWGHVDIRPFRLAIGQL